MFFSVSTPERIRAIPTRYHLGGGVGGGYVKRTQVFLSKYGVLSQISHPPSASNTCYD